MAPSSDKEPTNGSGATPEPEMDAIRAAERRGMLRAASLLVDRMQAADAMGLAFDTNAARQTGYKRDYLHAFGLQKKLDVSAFRAAFKRGGIANRIVTAEPAATWVSGARVVDVGDPDPSPFEDAVAALFNRLDAWARLQRADIVAGLGRYSVILIGAPGDRGTELGSVGPEGVRYLTIRAEDNAKLGALVKDPEDERYGQPEFYNLTLSDQTNAAKAHWSRIIHVADGALEDDLFGQPRLEAVWNHLNDLWKIVGAGAEATWRRADQGWQFDVDPTIPLTDSMVDDLKGQIDEMVHDLRRTLNTQGVTVKDLGSSVPAFGGNMDAVLRLIAGTLGIPVRILTGSERGELASSQDESNWNSRIAERRQEFAEPLVKALVLRLVEARALPEPADGMCRVEWPEIEELDESDKATVADRLAAANQKQQAAGGGLLMTGDEIRQRVYGLEPLEDDSAGIVGAAELADEDADEPEWVAVHRAADAHRARFAADLAAAWREAEIEPALAEVGLARLDQVVGDVAERHLLATLADGGEATAAVARQRGGFRSAVEFELEFDATNPSVEAWIAARAAELVTEVGAETKEVIRSLLRQAVDQCWPPEVLARRLREVVGLHTRQAKAVENLRARLEAAEPGDLVMAGKVRIRIPKEGATPALIDKRAAEYATRLRNQRARLIARTETIRASNEGQRQLWKQAQGSGLLPPDVKRIWIVTPDERLRDAHAAMAGQTRGLDEPFERPDGKQIEPGSEPNCRCAQGIAP